jgi:hypothetical protein
MPRIRLIHPDAPKDEAVATLSPLARVTWAYLPCHADRKGRLEDKPFNLRLEILPTDDVDMSHILSELEAGGLVARYAKGGRRYIQIRTFNKHQRPHKNEGDSVIPPPDGTPAPEWLEPTGQVASQTDVLATCPESSDQMRAALAVSDPDPDPVSDPVSENTPPPARDPSSTGTVAPAAARPKWRSSYEWWFAFGLAWRDGPGEGDHTYANGGDSKAQGELDGVLARMPDAELEGLWQRRGEFFERFFASKSQRLIDGRFAFALFVARWSDFRPDLPAPRAAPARASPPRDQSSGRARASTEYGTAGPQKL